MCFQMHSECQACLSKPVCQVCVTPKHTPVTCNVWRLALPLCLAQKLTRVSGCLEDEWSSKLASSSICNEWFCAAAGSVNTGPHHWWWGCKNCNSIGNQWNHSLFEKFSFSSSIALHSDCCSGNLEHSAMFPGSAVLHCQLDNQSWSKLGRAL